MPSHHIRFVGGGCLLVIRVLFLRYSNKSDAVNAQETAYVGPASIQTISLTATENMIDTENTTDAPTHDIQQSGIHSHQKNQSTSYQQNTRDQQESLSPTTASNASDTTQGTPSPNTTDTTVPSPALPLPDEIQYITPFFAQAPLGDRNYPYKEACEEAAFLLGRYHIRNITPDKHRMNKDILSLVDLQMNLFGYYADTNISEIQDFIQQRDLSVQTMVVDNPTVNDIKQLLADGFLVITPLAGPRIQNPHYGRGVVYHVILITGYNQDGFITQDVGTRRGANWIYSYDMIMDALDDFNPATQMADGGPRVLAIK